MTRNVFVAAFLLLTASPNYALAEERPSIFITAEEGAEIRNALGSYPLLDDSFQRSRAFVEEAISRGIEVPPPGEAGGYEHERHRQNYLEMHDAGLLFTITGEERYASFVRDMLFAYAELYPTLGPHPLAHHQLPGKIFHQILNDNVWLVHTSVAYDSIYEWLSEDDRGIIEGNVFRPMIEWILREENHYEFNRIHNHGTWTVAAAGMIAAVLRDEDVIEMALYGTDLSGEGGFLAQLDLLFSPDGYYMEGPYYIRFALMPFYYFAEAIERLQPERGIYEYRDQILRRALFTTVQSAFPNGVLPAINNASKTMDLQAPEIILANNLAYSRYGQDERLLGVATIQDQVILNGAGLQVARDYAALGSLPEMTWESVEFTDGPEGDEGGLGILRTGTGRDQTMLLMKYGVHGGGHGHFDKLHFILFDQNREVIPDYGFGRWINVEPKWGGRYLPEGRSYANQTVAHNTVVVDEMSQNAGNREAADAVAGQRHFFEGNRDGIQAVSARANDHYPGVNMQRTMFLIDDESMEHPFVIDLYRLTSDTPRQYDFPLHYYGQPIITALEYELHNRPRPMGEDHGYQHLWELARGRTDSTFQFTWLDGQRYYSFVTAAEPGTEVLFGRIGADDPEFNLRSEPMLLVRRQATDYLFASVFEPHGYFNEAREQSRNARPRVNNVLVVGHTDEASVVEVTTGDGLRWEVVVNNGASSREARTVTVNGRDYDLRGNFTVSRSN